IMFEREGGWSFSFSGSGFLGLYHVGVTACLDERAPHLLQGADKIYGISAGALSALSWVCGKSADFCCSIILDTVKEVRRRSLPSFDVIGLLKKGLCEHLPDNAHEVASGKLGISLTRWPDGQNVVVTEFATRDELIQAMVCSMFNPFYCGLVPPMFRGVRYVDGSLSNSVPLSERSSTITVSSYTGTLDICPRSRSACFHELTTCNVCFQTLTENLHRLVLELLPPDLRVQHPPSRQGYFDALRFLEQHGRLPALCRAFPCIIPVESFPSRARGGESLTAAPTLSSPALRKACEEDRGLFARFSRSFPGRMLTYFTLPCILPLEYVYFLQCLAQSKHLSKRWSRDRTQVSWLLVLWSFSVRGRGCGVGRRWPGAAPLSSCSVGDVPRSVPRPRPSPLSGFSPLPRVSGSWSGYRISLTTWRGCGGN
uniref:PNPLA domain-containing protein n=1 Tax=Ornithorhynchus anatinus TaxID=9258 RepID=K7ED98_ORNAN